MSRPRQETSPAYEYDALFLEGIGVGGRTKEILEHRRKTSVVRHRGWLIRRLLLLGDLVALLAAFAAAHYVTYGGGAAAALDGSIFALPAIVGVWIVLARAYGLYSRDEERTDHNTTDDFAAIFHATTIGAWAYVAGATVAGVGAPPLDLALAVWGLTLAGILVMRTVARATARRQMMYLQNAVIVGAGEVGQVIARKLMGHPEYGINLVGFLDSEPLGRAADLHHLADLGSPEALSDVVRSYDVERVIVAFSQQSHEEMLELIRTASELDVQVDVVPRLFESLGPNVSIHQLEGVPLFSLPPLRVTRTQLRVKRTLDVIGALLGLLVFAPLLAAIAIKVKLDSAGPVFYRAERVGRNAESFKLTKFRTMRIDADAELEELLRDPHISEEFRRTHKLRDDPRVTSFGRFLRRTSLDELPQLVNVLKGDISLVGPRPITTGEFRMLLAAHETSNGDDLPQLHPGEQMPGKELRGYWEVADFRPGVTGYWQITGRSQIGYEERVRLDVAYLRCWSLQLDIVIMAKTARALLASRGAY